MEIEIQKMKMTRVARNRGVNYETIVPVGS